MKNRKWIIVGLTFLFICLSILVKTNIINGFDEIIYKLVTFNMTNLTTSIYKFITFLGSTKFIVFLCIFFLVLFIILKKKNAGIIICSFLIISTIINNLLKIIFARERPDVIKLVVEDSYSFPSGHTMASVTMYGILMYIVLKSDINKNAKKLICIILSLIPIFVAISRVYLGAHYVSDVIGGIIVSTIILLSGTTIIDKNNWL